MVVLAPAPPVLDPSILSAYYARDALIGNSPIYIFYGPSTTTNSTRNSSRIQAHIYSIAGFKSFPRLTIAPTSPLYAAVRHLPEEQQGDEVCRGLAVSLLKYFVELSEPIKTCLTEMVMLERRENCSWAIFDEAHAAKLAGEMIHVENKKDVIDHVSSAMAEKHLSWTDVDVVLPLGSITRTTMSDPRNESEVDQMLADDGRPLVDYGDFNEIIPLFGLASFLPTSKLRRAPSRPTAVGRSKALAQDQRESLRREMKELVDTEESYILKLHDLEESVAAKYTRNVSNKPQESMDPNERRMHQLFPESLSRIHDLNTEFIREISLALNSDPSGVDSVAKLLLQHFPRFKDSYQDYLKASAHFPTILNQILRSGPSRHAEGLQQTGEQRLKSLLIEPVQRLPRYSLFIDNIVNHLPATHPAVGKFLRAKDIVTDICALDQDEALDNDRVIAELRKLVVNWPENLVPLGRLITAVDVTELRAPLTMHFFKEESIQCMLLLFPDYVMVLRKLGEHALSARGLLAEVDRIASIGSTASLQPRSLNLSFVFPLKETRFVESHNGSLVSLSCIQEISNERSKSSESDNHAIVTQEYRLLGAYEGKAARWTEEVARARVEYRFPEKLRETDKWGLRTNSPRVNDIGVVAAVFEDDCHSDRTLQRRLQSRVQVILQRRKECDANDSSRARLPPVEITAHVVVLESHKYHLEFAGLDGVYSTDEIYADDFWTVFTKRLSNLHRIHSQPLTLEMAQMRISLSQKIVNSIRPRFAAEEGRPRSRFRPVSPFKAFSGFLTGSLREQATVAKQLVIDNPGAFSYSRSEIVSCDPPGRPDTDPLRSKVTLIDSMDQHRHGSLPQLEATLSTYIVALHSRNGNIVGKVLRGRSGADELRVNELYNTLIEDSSQHQTAAEVSVDVLFSSFEKFLNHEWKDRMGPILSSSLLEKMKSLFGKPRTGQTNGRFKSLLSEMTPQNRRAFSAIIKLLSDLLDASGNDGDRGALTVSFAEALVTTENPHDYIHLLDCLVEDLDALFDDFGTDVLASDALQRARSTNTGSISSNGSSLRKRFGLSGLTRENSRTETESKVSQMWRTLSKKASGDGDPQTPSLSRSFLSRSRSTDNDGRKQIGMLPTFRDQFSSSNARQDGLYPRPGSAHNVVPDLISTARGGLHPIQRPPKNKRRSSLSDLTHLQQLSSPPLESKSQLRKPELEPISSSPQAIREPTKTQSPPGSILDPPIRFPSKLPSPTNRKENVRPGGITADQAKSAKQNINGSAGSSMSPRKHELAHSRIPSLRHGLRELPNASNTPSPPPRKLSSPQKMRMQSPQKLRERLEKEKRAIQEAEPPLRTELARIGEELAALRSPQKRLNSPSTDFSQRVAALENKVSRALNDLAKQNKSIQADLESSLVVSEKKARSLDELYREANAENELLYERFNTELVKVLKSVKGGEGVEEMRSKLKESQSDAARLRKENQRLKRENVGLRSQLKEV